MEKIKNAIKTIWNWISTDGLLHLLVCCSLMLALTPVIGIWWALGITIVSSIGKELIDYFIEKDNNKTQVHHDLICDGIGIIVAILWLIMWFLMW